MWREEMSSRPNEENGSGGVATSTKPLRIYAVAGVGSVATCTGLAGVSTVAFGAVAALSFGFGAATFAFGWGVAFTT